MGRQIGKGFTDKSGWDAHLLDKAPALEGEYFPGYLGYTGPLGGVGQEKAVKLSINQNIVHTGPS